MPVTEGLMITELNSLVDQDGTELFVLVSDPSVTPVNKKVAADYAPVRAQVMFTVPGTLAVDTDAAPWFICSVPGGLQLLGAALAVKTASSGVPIIADIECSCNGGYNWYSIFSALPSLAIGSKYSESGTLFVTHIDQGDILRLAVRQIGTTGADLTASLWVRQGGTGTGCVTTSTSTTTLTSSSTSTTTGTTSSTSSSSSTTTTLAWKSPSAVYSSCGEHAAGPASYFTDGNTGSCWIHLVNEAHEIIVDLGETKYVTKVRLYVYDQEQSQWGSFQVYISDDPNSWPAPALPLGIFRGGEYGAEWVEQSMAPAAPPAIKTGRYLKLSSIDTDDVLNHVMGAEFQVYAS